LKTINPVGIASQQGQSLTKQDIQMKKIHGVIATPSLVFVSISNGDVATFLNNTPVCTLGASDSTGNSGLSPKAIAQNMAEALGVELVEVSMDVPSDTDWNWADVAELLPPQPAFTRQEASEYVGSECLSPSHGPWQFAAMQYPGGDRAVVLQNREEQPIFVLREDYSGNLGTQRESDKHWICRVPVMYATLKEIVEVLANHPQSKDGNSVVHYAYHRAKGATMGSLVTGDPK
jgi:hypothetical protein